MQNYRNLLLEFDEISAYETPKKFKYNALKYKVLCLKEKLDGEFKHTFKIDDQIQDASFFCDIILPNSIIEKAKSNFLYSIRISNFGNLAALTFEEIINDDLTKKLIRIINEAGFNFIPNQILDQDYDGKFEDFKLF